MNKPLDSSLVLAIELSYHTYNHGFDGPAAFSWQQSVLAEHEAVPRSFQ